jgi:hypothetical protein
MRKLPAHFSDKDVNGGRFSTMVGLMALVAVVAWFLVLAPSLVDFGVAVAAAVAWCIWLARHPEDDASDA